MAAAVLPIRMPACMPAWWQLSPRRLLWEQWPLLQEAVLAFVRYCYEDGVEERMDVQSTLALLHAAHFFGAPRLAGLCDLALSRNFKHASPSDEGASLGPLNLPYSMY